MDRVKKWILTKDPKTFAFGVLLLVCSAIAINGLLRKGFTSYYLTGAVLLAFFGFKMILRSKR